jgi:ribA/ribD-fused uncharacterized protein
MIKLFDKQMNETKYDVPTYQIEVFPLENFSPFGLIMEDLYFSTAEHAFQYLKFADTNIEIAEKIRKTLSPDEARNIAHQNKAYRPFDWTDVKYKKMEKVLRLKVKQNSKVKEVLLNTDDLIIAECCIDEDTDWGIDNNNIGENHLGNIWMKIRADLKRI